MKKWFALLLVLTLCIGLMPVSVGAEGTVRLNVAIEEGSFTSVRYYLNGSTRATRITGLSASIDLQSGDTIKLLVACASGVSFGGYYLGSERLAGSNPASFTAGTDFKDGDTIAIRSLSNDFIPLAYDGSAVTLETRGGFPWTNTDGELASGNQGVADASVLKATATRAGTLVFQYRTSVTNGSGWLLYKKGSELTKANYSSADNYENRSAFTGSAAAWKDAQVEVEENDELYFLLYKETANAGCDDTVYLRGFAFAAEGYSVNAVSSGRGTAAVTESTVGVGTSVTFTAEPDPGCKFYGWTENGRFVTAAPSYTRSIYEDTTLTAVFAEAGGLAARIGGIFYPTLADAVAAADGTTTVILTDDARLEEDLTLPPDLTLVIPYDADRTDVDRGQHSGTFSTRLYSNSYENGIVSTLTEQGTDVTYTLTVAAGKTLTVGPNSLLTLGGLYAGSSRGTSGQTCGAHSEIELEEGALLNVSGGILSCCGYIYGDGAISVTDHGSAYENFVVTDFHGGTDFLGNFTNGVFPFCGYLVLNIQVPLTADSSSYLNGYCTLPAGGQFYNIAANVVGSYGLVRMESGSTVTISYDQSRKVGSFGTTKIEMDGNASVGNLVLDLAGTEMDTSSFDCPLPYSIALEQTGGNLTVEAKIRLMPGTEFRVAEGSNVTLAEGAKLIVEGADAAMPNGSSYPSASKLRSAGYSTVGTAVVAGSLTVQDGATLNCTTPLVTTGSGTVTVAAGATASGTMVVQSEGQTVAQAQSNSARQTIAAGKAYTYEDGAWAITTVEPNYYTITYHWADGTTTEESLPYGASPTGTVHAYREDETYNYWYAWQEETLPDGTASNYSQGLPKVTGDKEYTEVVYKNYNEYAVNFFNTDAALKTTYLTGRTNYHYGDPVTAPADPTRAGDDEYSYAFLGWNTKKTAETGCAADEIPTVTGDANYFAIYSKTPVNYTVTWYDEDGATVLATTQEGFGTTVSFTGETPTREGYVLTGWTSEDVTVTDGSFPMPAQNVSLTAVWEEAPAVTLTASNFTDKTKGAATVTITDAANGVFTVSCERACVVAIENNDGSYTKVPYSSGSGNTYSFSLGENFDADIKLVVAIRGDANGDGNLTRVDSTLILRAVTYKGTAVNSTLTALGTIVGDVNGGGITRVDATLILRTVTFKGTAVNSSIAW